MMNEDDLNMIQYFHQERGDISRWSGWEDRKSVIEEEYPELIKAIDDLKIAHKILDAVVDSLGKDW